MLQSWLTLAVCFLILGSFTHLILNWRESHQNAISVLPTSEIALSSSSSKGRKRERNHKQTNKQMNNKPKTSTYSICALQRKLFAQGGNGAFAPDDENLGEEMSWSF